MQKLGLHSTADIILYAVPVILAGNHINKTSMDGMLLGSKILVERGVPAKWVSVADPPGLMLKHFVRTASGLLPAGIAFTSNGSRTEFDWKRDIRLDCKALRLKAKQTD
jgi:hypothetical protein